MSLILIKFDEDKTFAAESIWVYNTQTRMWMQATAPEAAPPPPAETVASVATAAAPGLALARPASHETTDGQFDRHKVLARDDVARNPPPKSSKRRTRDESAALQNTILLAIHGSPDCDTAELMNAISSQANAPDTSADMWGLITPLVDRGLALKQGGASSTGTRTRYKFNLTKRGQEFVRLMQRTPEGRSGNPFPSSPP